MDKFKQIFSLEPVPFSDHISAQELVQGFILAGVFGLIGTIPWILLGLTGFIASILGFVIALAAFKGFVMGAGKMHKLGIVAIVVVVLIAVPFSELVLLVIDGLNYGLTLAEVFSLLDLVIADNIGSIAMSIIIGYIFAFLGAWRVIRQ